MSQYMEALTIGDTIKMKGPAGHVLYEGRGCARPIQLLVQLLCYRINWLLLCYLGDWQSILNPFKLRESQW